MNSRIGLAGAAAALFALAGVTAFNEWLAGLHYAYLWFGLAMAVSVLALAMPSDPAPH